MRIVYIAHSRIPSRNANSIHVMNICNELAKLGHHVTLLTPHWKETEKTDDVYSFYGVKPDFPVKKLWFPQFIRGASSISGVHAAKKLRSLKPDLVVGRSIYGCAAAAFLGYPVIFDSHSPIWESGRIPLSLFKIMVRQSSFRKLVVNSNALRNIYLASDLFKRTGFDPTSIVVAHNGSNIYSLTDKAELPGEKEKIKVGYFGHLYKGRGIDLIIRIAEKMKEHDFYVVGGEEKDIAYWKAQTNSPNIYFIGFKPYAEVYKYRNSCDILLAPYQKVAAPDAAPGNQTPYMNPIKVIEYMSSRKPVVASNLPAIRELLDEKSAVLAHCEDSGEWIEAIGKLVSDKEFSGKLAAEAYSRFIKDYTWQTRAQKLIAL